MFNYFLAENLKTKRTFTKKLIFIAPAFTFLMAILLAFDYYVVDSYNWWYMSILPCIMALECSLMCSVDYKYGNKAVLSLPVDLKKIWYAKVLVVLKNIAFSNIVLFILTSVLSCFINIKSVLHIPVINGAFAIFVLSVTFMWQAPLWIYLNHKINKYICVILSIALNTIFQILSVSMKAWYLIPFCYPARLMCSVIKILPNGLPAVKDSITFKPELLNTSSVLVIIIASLILSVVITYLTGKSFSTFQVSKERRTK